MASTQPTGLSPSEKAFLAFEWSKNAQWQAYFDSLFPTPPMNKVLKWKKKFYKSQIDPLFNTELTNVDDVLLGKSSTEPTNQTCPPSASRASASFDNSNQRSYYSNSTGLTARNGYLWHMTSTICAIVLPVGLLFSVVAGFIGKSQVSFLATISLLVAFVTRIFVCCGVPPIKFWPMAELSRSFSQDLPIYLQNAIFNDATHGLIFLLFTGPLPPSLPLAISPAISCALIMAQMLGENCGFPQLICSNALTKRFVTMADQKRFVLLQLRADIEILYFILFILSHVVTLNVSVGDFLIPLFLLFQLLKIRIQTCAFSQSTIRNLDGIIKQWTSHQLCPQMINSAYMRLRALLPSHLLSGN